MGLDHVLLKEQAEEDTTEEDALKRYITTVKAATLVVGYSLPGRLVRRVSKREKEGNLLWIAAASMMLETTLRNDLGVPLTATLQRRLARTQPYTLQALLHHNRNGCVAHVVAALMSLSDELSHVSTRLFSSGWISRSRNARPWVNGAESTVERLPETLEVSDDAVYILVQGAVFSSDWGEVRVGLPPATTSRPPCRFPTVRPPNHVPYHACAPPPQVYAPALLSHNTGQSQMLAKLGGHIHFTLAGKATAAAGGGAAKGASHATHTFTRIAAGRFIKVPVDMQLMGRVQSVVAPMMSTAELWGATSAQEIQGDEAVQDGNGIQPSSPLPERSYPRTFTARDFATTALFESPANTQQVRRRASWSRAAFSTTLTMR